VERKSIADLVSTLTSGKLRYLLADLAALPRAAVVIEDRYSSVFRLEHVRPALVADGLAEAQVRFPSVPIFFCETRTLAADWTYRFLRAAVEELTAGQHADRMTARLATAEGPLPKEPSTAEVRAWAVAQGIPVADRGRLRPEVWAAYQAAHDR
jgi:hypothetical protein